MEKEARWNMTGQKEKHCELETGYKGKLGTGKGCPETSIRGFHDPLSGLNPK